MGNARFGLQAAKLRFVLGTVLFLSLFSGQIQARGPTCESLFLKDSSRQYVVSRLAEQGEGQTLRSHPKLKIVSWNVFNLKIPEVEYPVGSEAYRNTPQREQLRFAKTEGQLLQLKKVFDDLNADIYVLQEVFSRETLQYVVDNYLGSKYDVILERGNDKRGIQVGFLVKKSLNASYELRSNKHLKFESDYGVYAAGTPIFARDLAVLYLRQKDGSNSRASEDPDLIVMGSHFKSKRPTIGDFESTNLREVEAQTAARIFRETDLKHQGRVPIAFLLDSNTRHDAPETSALREVSKDSLALMGDKLTADEKVTHTYHPIHGRLDAKQVDAQLLNDAMAAILKKSYVYHYKDQTGKDKVYQGKWEAKAYPLNFNQRKKNPSDHMPVVAEYDMSKK